MAEYLEIAIQPHKLSATPAGNRLVREPVGPLEKRKGKFKRFFDAAPFRFIKLRRVRTATRGVVY
jgi:hypothetical protein